MSLQSHTTNPPEGFSGCACKRAHTCICKCLWVWLSGCMFIWQYIHLYGRIHECQIQGPRILFLHCFQSSQPVALAPICLPQGTMLEDLLHLALIVDMLVLVNLALHMRECVYMCVCAYVCAHLCTAWGTVWGRQLSQRPECAGEPWWIHVPHTGPQLMRTSLCPHCGLGTSLGDDAQAEGA